MRDLDRCQFEVSLDGINYPVADVDVIADRLLLVVEIGERQRGFFSVPPGSWARTGTARVVRAMKATTAARRTMAVS
jgi:hypothetical protein